MTAIKFKHLNVRHWRQFQNVEIEFSPSVTILTGRNGTGKTTILNFLAHHSIFHSAFLSSPPQPRDSFGRFTSGIWGRDEDIPAEQFDNIGNIIYSDGSVSNIDIAREVKVNFVPRISPSVSVSVLNIPSHRRLPSYKKVDSIPTSPVTGEQALAAYQQEFWNSALGAVSRTTPLTKMKEAIISMAAFGPGNSRVTPNVESEELFFEFERRLKEIIPKNIGFRRIVVQIPDVIIETESGRFLIDASSGGLMSLIDIAWQITLFGSMDKNFVVVIDEPENHLHPSMQREFLPALVAAFPDVQFVVATHSPFVVSSVRRAQVYAFDIEERENMFSGIADDLSSTRNSVVTVPVNLNDRASASEVLRQVLGVPISVPIWAENELNSILDRFRGSEFTAVDIQNLHSELEAEGLSEFLPDLIARAAGRDA